jgi:hypothetical protein
MRVAQRLRTRSGAGGIGFCYETDPWLFNDRSGSHGPLVVAWDSNIVIYFQKYGRRLIDGEDVEEVDASLRDELTALGMLVDWWFTRDIRFIVSSALWEDERRPASATDRRRRYGAMDALVEALTFQMDAWEQPDWRDLLRAELGELQRLERDPMTSLLAAFPTGVRDREIVREAILCGADVLLTCDRKFIKRGATLPGSVTKVLAPTQLMDRLLELGMYQFWAGGLLDHAGCPFSSASVVAGDLGKLPLLLSALAGY